MHVKGDCERFFMIFSSILVFFIGFSFSLNGKAVNVVSKDRIISLAPAITEIIFTLDEKANVIGVTRFCDKPLKAKLIKKIGGFIDPQLETIVTLKPTVVIGADIPSHQQVLQQLAKLKVATLFISNNKITDIKKSTISVGKILHLEKRAEQLVEKFNHDLLSVKNLIKCPDSTKILLAISSKPFIVAGTKTYPNEVLNLIGVQSTEINSSSDWPIWSEEIMLKNAPRAIIAIGGQSLAQELKKELALILSHKNLKDTVVIFPQLPILQRPGLTLANDAKRLAKLLTNHGICHFAKK